ncbi:MAG: hypothetical protein OH318_02425 [Candidatus Parvarchaeota archaeon]|nr:hypothetical protein [Candidatus Rehaiarchaeum fermentans]
MRGQTSKEEYIFFAVIVPLIVIILMIYLLQSSQLAAALPVGCSDNGILENQFTQAEYGLPNRLQGDTPLTRCFGINACYAKSLANSTCIRHWCYYYYYLQGLRNGTLSQAATACIQSPPIQVLNNCKDLSPLNPATLFSCYESTTVADNATMIESCAINVSVCIPGDGPFCPPCVGVLG